VFLIGVGISQAAFAWEVDLSRRSKTFRQQELSPAQTKSNQDPGFFERLVDVEPPAQEVVILNTKNGFVPSTVKFRKGASYKVHVVNVNPVEKNVSFILDSFSEHHATYFGEIKTFLVSPKKEGIYSFQCPETSSQGRLVVFEESLPMQPDVIPRQPASENTYAPK
jgi:hypothetical protein